MTDLPPAPAALASAGTSPAPDHRLIRLVMALRRQGITDQRVLPAMERVPREQFLDPALASYAFEDRALPIACGQTISQPYVVAFMSQALRVEPEHKVLEVGCGSGYQAAVLGLLARKVHTVERYRTLLRTARARLAALHAGNVTAHLGDGNLGLPGEAPFDRIIVTAAASGPPTALVEQLAPSGILVMPLAREPVEGGQMLVRIRRTGRGIETEDLLPVRFVPLVTGVAQEL